MVGRFQGLSLSYERFPYDTQDLTIKLRAPSLYDNATVSFVGAAGMAVEAEPPDWSVERVTVASVPYQFSLPRGLQTNPNDPFLSWLESLPGFSFADSSPAFAELTITIQVSRKSQYMLWNFVILISMLVWLSFPTRVLSNLLSPSLAFSAQVWLSFLTFFFAADAIDVRLSVALTVILAINVYQIVLVDMMPATG